MEDEYINNNSIVEEESYNGDDAPDYDPDMGGGSFPPEMGGVPDGGQYSAEHYNYLVNLHSTEYQRDLMKMVTRSHLSPKLKRALKIVVRNFFSHTAFLSYQKDGDMAEIDLAINLNIAVASATKADINTPEYPHILENISSHFNRFIITRTFGPNRERLVQGRQSMENITRMADNDEKRQKRKGLGIWGMITGNSGGEE
jgi:hypothetical protein